MSKFCTRWNLSSTPDGEVGLYDNTETILMDKSLPIVKLVYKIFVPSKVRQFYSIRPWRLYNFHSVQNVARFEIETVKQNKSH
jgi:hypothetical protein